MKEKVSIIVPIFNKESKLARCLESIKHQTYPNLEVILIDDGSTDHSFDIAMTFCHTDQRFRSIRTKNYGVSHARNIGISEASGSYINFVDADDYLELNAIETLINNSEPTVDLVIMGKICFEGNRTWFSELKEVKNISCKELKQTFDHNFKNYMYHSPVCKLYKKGNITVLFDENISYGEDLIFNLNYLKNCKNITSLSYCGYYYEISDNSLTKKIHQNEIKIIYLLYHEVINFYLMNINDEIEESNLLTINNMFILSFKLLLNKMIINHGRYSDFKSLFKEEECVKLKQELSLNYYNQFIYFFLKVKAQIKMILNRR